MKFWDLVEWVYSKLPKVKKPRYDLSILDRVKWSFIAVILYLLLSYAPLIGVSSTGAGVFEELVVILGASFGSILSLGIGPIIVGYLLAELLVGSGELDIDITTEAGRAKFEKLAKFLMVIFGLFEAIVHATIGWFQPSKTLVLGLASLLSFLGPLSLVVAKLIAITFIVIQLMIGVILAHLLDDLSQKWGFTSGINLFIMASVSREVFIQLFNPLPQIPGIESPPIGAIPQLFYFASQGEFREFIAILIKIVVIVAIVVLSIYAYMVKIPIPTSFGKIPGKSLRYYVRLLYTGNIPVIFAFAFLHEIILIAWVFQRIGFPILGTLANGQPVSGLIYYIYPNTGFLIALLFGALNWQEIIRTLISSLYFVGTSILFSYYFVLATGQDAKGLAYQITKMFSQMGLARDPRIVEKFLEKIIPCVTFLGGFIVGFLALLSYWAGIPIGGTSILLATMIAYQVYEQLKEMGAIKALYKWLEEIE